MNCNNFLPECLRPATSSERTSLLGDNDQLWLICSRLHSARQLLCLWRALSARVWFRSMAGPSFGDPELSGTDPVDIGSATGTGWSCGIGQKFGHFLCFHLANDFLQGGAESLFINWSHFSDYFGGADCSSEMASYSAQ